MNASFQLTPQAADDMEEIWCYIAEDNRDAADRVEIEIVATCRRLARYPLMGSVRREITLRPVRFWTLPKFSNYVVVYRPETDPLQVIAILHGKRDLKMALEGRL